MSDDAQTQTVVPQAPVPDAPPVEPKAAEPQAACDTGKTWILLVMLLVGLSAVVAGGQIYLSINKTPSIPLATSEVELAQKVADLELRLMTLEKAPQPAGGEAKDTKTDTLKNAGSDDIEKLKVGLAGLSTALGMLQGEIEKAAKVSGESQTNMRVGLATVLGFMQMQRVALQGQQFEKERQDLRKVADGDQTLIELLLKIEPYALGGVSTPAQIAREWRLKSGEAQNAMRKANAQTWMDRIVVALESLVSIRSLNPSATKTLSFDGIQLDLEEGRLKNALDGIAALPPEAQTLLGETHKKIEDRLALEAALSDTFTHLMVRGSQPQPSPEGEAAQDKGTP